MAVYHVIPELSLAHMPNAFSVIRFFYFWYPGLLLRSNPGLELANAFGVTEHKRLL
jgi:hypothetical protein